jgi:hypothetical protein
MVKLTEGAAQDVESFGDHVKGAFGSSWKEELCEGNHIDGEIAVGSPTLLVILRPTEVESVVPKCNNRVFSFALHPFVILLDN